MALKREYGQLTLASSIFTISAWLTEKDTCANIVDPEEMARNEPSHQDLHCLSSFFMNILFYTETPICVSEHV